MMRFAWVIAVLATVGAAEVCLRSGQDRTQAELYRLEAKRLQVRRTLWEQQLRASELSAPQETRKRGLGWALEVREPGPLPPAEKPQFAGRKSGGSAVAVRTR